jgi:tetratricopeptide (TPR) repeat protein
VTNAELPFAFGAAGQFRLKHTNEDTVNTIDTRNDDKAAGMYLVEGARHEQSEKWHAAETAYRSAAALSAPDPRVRYYARNNLGYVLVQLEKFDEAVEWCLEAIAVNPEQYNAHKNLGLAYQGQGLWTKAAWSLLQATCLCPNNARAWQHLQQLLKARPGLIEQDRELSNGVSKVQAALEEDGYSRIPVEHGCCFRPKEIPPEQ